MKLIVLFISAICTSMVSALPAQTDVHNAEHLFDENGIAYLKVANVGKTYNPAFVSLYALAYAGKEDYCKSGISPDAAKFCNSAEWLVANLRDVGNGCAVWLYDFDSTYNDVSIKAPWYSAFGQAVGIEVLVAAFEKFEDARFLRCAKSACEVLLTSISEGGLLFDRDGFYWFEEIPAPRDNPSHILNGHMRAMLAIERLWRVTGDERYKKSFDRAAESLKRNFILFDTGYALRYDLNPKKEGLLFRFGNPYGGMLPSMAIDSVKLVDPISGRGQVLDVGAPGDADGPCRIAGNDWLQAGEMDGRSVRQLKPVLSGNSLHRPDGGMDAPGTYFYLDLPDIAWTNNFRSSWLELVVGYKDVEKGDCGVYLRSMAPGPAFRLLRDGELFSGGTGEWREWRVPVRPSDLGFWCGGLYAEKHALYLRRLADIDADFSVLAEKAASYAYLAGVKMRGDAEIATSPISLPRQTPPLPFFSLDANGVVRQHMPDSGSKFINGVWDKSSSVGTPAYSPFYIAGCQILDPKLILTIEPSRIRAEPAYEWLYENAVKLPNGSLTWRFEYDNAYNDVLTESPWASSFSQVYVIKALRKAVDEKRTTPRHDYYDLYARAIDAYKVPLKDGGFTSFSEYGRFYEEVTNGTHVLNAHLASMAELQRHELARDVFETGVSTLKNVLHLFDSGYWLRYDMNPKKEFLVQLDWLQGFKSPLVARAELVDTRNGKMVAVDAGALCPFAGQNRFAGCDWCSPKKEDGRRCLPFTNGYRVRSKVVKGGTRHNVMFNFALPDRSFCELFDVPIYVLRLRYKDVAKGRFAIKTQSICNGNVLEFRPIRNGLLECTGDGQWKTANFEVEQNALGWYVGPEYQKFVVEQLESLGGKDWFFAQYALRHKEFLNRIRKEQE